MVLPGDELIVKLHHIGMRDGNIVVNVETSNSRGEKLFKVQLKFLSQALSMSSLAKVPKNLGWVWTVQ